LVRMTLRFVLTANERDEGWSSALKGGKFLKKPAGEGGGIVRRVLFKTNLRSKSKEETRCTSGGKKNIKWD